MVEPARAPKVRPPVVYPDTDGEPMAENTVQYEWIVKIKGNLDALLPDDFVAGDLFWYPVEGDPTVRTAPDVMVAFGRPKGHRSSYMQWEEAGVAPQVLFEIWSPGNRWVDKARKLAFYERYGVQEFYGYDPDTDELTALVRGPGGLDPRDCSEGFTSPLTGVRFVPSEDGLRIEGPDGQPFRTFAEIIEAASAAEAQARDAEAQARDAEARAERLAEKLRALGLDPDAI